MNSLSITLTGTATMRLEQQPTLITGALNPGGRMPVRGGSSRSAEGARARPGPRAGRVARARCFWQSDRSSSTWGTGTRSSGTSRRRSMPLHSPEALRSQAAPRTRLRRTTRSGSRRSSMRDTLRDPTPASTYNLQLEQPGDQRVVINSGAYWTGEQPTARDMTTPSTRPTRILRQMEIPATSATSTSKSLTIELRSYFAGSRFSQAPRLVRRWRSARS